MDRHWVPKAEQQRVENLRKQLRAEARAQISRSGSFRSKASPSSEESSPTMSPAPQRGGGLRRSLPVQEARSPSSSVGGSDTLPSKVRAEFTDTTCLRRRIGCSGTTAGLFNDFVIELERLSLSHNFSFDVYRHVAVVYSSESLRIDEGIERVVITLLPSAVRSATKDLAVTSGTARGLGQKSGGSLQLSIGSSLGSPLRRENVAESFLVQPMVMVSVLLLLSSSASALTFCICSFSRVVSAGYCGMVCRSQVHEHPCFSLAAL